MFNFTQRREEHKELMKRLAIVGGALQSISIAQDCHIPEGNPLPKATYLQIPSDRYAAIFNDVYCRRCTKPNDILYSDEEQAASAIEHVDFTRSIVLFCRFHKGSAAPPHWHHETEQLTFYAGAGELIVSEKEGQTVHKIVPRMRCTIPPRTVHRTAFTEAGFCVSVLTL